MGKFFYYDCDANEKNKNMLITSVVEEYEVGKSRPILTMKDFKEEKCGRQEFTYGWEESGVQPRQLQKWKVDSSILERSSYH